MFVVLGIVNGAGGPERRFGTVRGDQILSGGPIQAAAVAVRTGPMSEVWRKRLWAFCVVAAGLLPSSGNLLAGDDLTIITEDYPPLNYVEDGALGGPAVDIVRAIQERLGGGAR